MVDHSGRLVCVLNENIAPKNKAHSFVENPVLDARRVREC